MSDRGVTTHGNGSGALDDPIMNEHHLSFGGEDKEETYMTARSVYSTLGMMSFPSWSLAFLILNTARVATIVLKTKSMARCLPGHTLHDVK